MTLNVRSHNIMHEQEEYKCKREKKSLLCYFGVGVKYTRIRHQQKLDMNCDFSSNNNIWARFYEFLWQPFSILMGYFYYDRLIKISRMRFW